MWWPRGEAYAGPAPYGNSLVSEKELTLLKMSVDLDDLLSVVTDKKKQLMGRKCSHG